MHNVVRLFADHRIK